MGPFSNAVFSSKELFDEHSLNELSLLKDGGARLAYVYDKVKENMENIFSEFYASIDNIDNEMDDNNNDSELNEYKVKLDFLRIKALKK